jgi:hypothetical protein
MDPLIQKELDAAAISEQVEAVLRDELYWFPVRHHSHTAARHLASAIQTRRPKVVFIEGPFEANHLIPFVVDAQTTPPIAIYSSYRDDDNVLGLNGVVSPAVDIPARFAVWYPLTAYSPEYVAMKTARSLGAEVVFIDLPHHALVEPKRSAPEPAKPTPSAPNEDQLVTTSGFYQRLAAAAGYKTWDEAWDTLFENPYGDDYEAYRRELATFCCGVRATSDPAVETAGGTIPRERHFMKVIRETLQTRKLKPEQALVVCGGFHLFLDRDDEQPPPAPPAGTTYTTVVPYSFFRVSDMAGYGAGNRAPQFYQACFNLIGDGRADDIALEHAVAVLRQMRKEGEPLSTADAIAITHHAGMLARLRGRVHTTLDDIDDALVTCCCKGALADEGVKLRAAMDAAAIGAKIGKVTDKLGRRFPHATDGPRPRRRARQGEKARGAARQARPPGGAPLRVPAPTRLSRNPVRRPVVDGRRLLRHYFSRRLATQVGPEDRAGADRTEPLRRHRRKRRRRPSARGHRPSGSQRRRHLRPTVARREHGPARPRAGRRGGGRQGRRRRSVVPVAGRGAAAPSRTRPLRLVPRAAPRRRRGSAVALLRPSVFRVARLGFGSG